MLKYNPDAHWSAAFYRNLNLNLNLIQYTDGRHILNVNRDEIETMQLVSDWTPWLPIDYIVHPWYRDMNGTGT